MNSAPAVSSRLARLAKVGLRLGVAAVVVAGILRTTAGARDKFISSGFSFDQLDPAWLVVSGVLFLVGTLPASWFWWRSLSAMGQRVDWLPSLRAYFVGGLGKYVPGKAFVVVLRTLLLRSERIDSRIVVFSVFVETLTVMAVGGVLGSLLVALLTRENRELSLGALLTAGLVTIPTLPPVFRSALRLLGKRRHLEGVDEALRGIRFRLLAQGWIGLAFGWGLMGLSLWATLRALPDSALAAAPGLADWPLLTACVSLSVVAGFLSFLPAGIGAREYVTIRLLAPVYGEVAAIVSAVVLRLVWLLSESIAAIILYRWGGRGPGEEQT